MRYDWGQGEIGECNVFVESYLLDINDDRVTRIGGCQACPANYFRRGESCDCASCSCAYWLPTYGEERYNAGSCGGSNGGNCDGICRGRCEAGQGESHGCGTPDTNRGRECSTCAAGKYRNDLNTLVCADCKTCSTAQRERRTPCGPVYDRTCVQCGAGNIVTGADLDTCTECNAGAYMGTYARASDNTCVKCSDCLRTQGVATPCRNNADRTCAACPTNQRAPQLNGDCRGCVGGYVWGVSGCILCENAACGLTQYIKCTTSVDLMGGRDCLHCQGHNHASSTKCAAGYGVSVFCAGDKQEAIACTACAAGTERPDGTAMVANAGNTVQIQQCKACATGKYKVGTGTGDCQACTNKPGDNSVYAAWTATAGSSVCPWVCNAGYYSNGADCLLCPTGQWSGTVGVTACQACTNAPSGQGLAYYLARTGAATTTTNTCPWECGAGYVKSSGGCFQCANGSSFREAWQNVATDDLMNTCYACAGCQDSRLYSPGSYMTRECAYNRDRGCTICTTWCDAGQYRTALCNTTHNRQCQACATRCPAGYHLSGQACTGSTDYDVVQANCRPCLSLSQCVPGTAYLSGTCAGNTSYSNACLDCDKAKSCPGQYRGGCANLSNTRCLDYRACPTGYYLADESPDRDGTCKACSTCEGLGQLRACTKFDDAVCGGSSCNGVVPCPTRTNSNRSAYFCDYTRGDARASCGVCPPGYGSDGQFCLECPRGFTCDRIGGIACRGQCGAGVRSACESQYGLGYAVCDTACELPAPDTRLPWRGSYVQAQTELCATYFLCTVGYYKFFGTGGSVECQPCNASLLPTRGVLDMWVTEGLSAFDDSSCLWECNLLLSIKNGSGKCVQKPGRESGVTTATSNLAGAWKSASGVGGGCGMGWTSQAGVAMAPGECLACQPLVGDVMRWKDQTDQCEFECVHTGAVRRGSVCVPARWVCGLEGLVRQLLDTTSSCIPQSFPWNMAGYAKTTSTAGGWGVVTESRVTASFLAATLAQYPLLASVGYGIKRRHTVTMTAGGTARTVEGRLCSVTQAVRVGNWSYAFGSLCNQSFLVYLNLSATTTGTGLGVLIGSSARGWRDGFRTQALFESELYVAARADSTGTVFVLDRWNCLLREVVVWDWPGSYLTRVHTLWGDTDKLQLAVPQAKCYGDGSLAWPRRFWALDPDWLAFADEDGLWQFDTRTRELLVIVRESAGGFEADGLAGVVLQGPTVMVLTFLDGRVWTVRAAQALCPEGRTSLRGGGCDIECRLAASDGSRMHWVSELSGDCLPCTTSAQMVCGLGEELVPCSAWRDAYCRRCEFALDPACLACPGETAQSKPCVRCDITTVSVDALARVYTDVGEGLVIRYTSSGTIRVSADVRATVLVVGGGGNGGANNGGGGGGAGTVIFAENVTIQGGTTLAVTVGGAMQASSLGAGFVASGGGNGDVAHGATGGSGGGVGGPSTVFGVSGIYTSANAFANAGAGGGNTGYYYGGAGGGAGGAGSPGQCGAGGAGLSSVNILGKASVFSNVFGQAYTSVAVNGAVAGGGTGSKCCDNQNCGSNGLGGFGATFANNGGNGVANTGSGGGGASWGSAGAGGSGLVLIKILPWYGVAQAPQQQPSSCVCTARSDSVYVSPGTCDASTMRPLPPCAAGWYAASDAGVTTGWYCVKCPAYTASLYAGATMLDQCKCVYGMTRRAGRCVGEALYEEFDALLCAGEACKVPPNAVRYVGDGIACRWYCNAGYYRDTRAGFQSQCRRCLVGMGSNRTRGDDDSPWSCE